MTTDSRRTRRRPCSVRAWALVIVQILSLVFQNTFAVANPTAGATAAGAATITQSGSTLTVTQSTNRAVINWQDFSINQGEVTNFVLPGSNAAVLNRVVGGNPSVLLGTLQSNGQVLLINPNGILIGPTGQINVNSFIGSTLNISDAQFLEGGDLDLSGSSTAGVVNYGTINALEGDIYLVGATVQNHGSLSAPGGVVGLAAGQDVRLVDAAHPHLVVRPTTRSLGGTGVHNTGTIEAMQAELMAAGGNIYALAINNEGTIRATGSAEVGGRIYLVSDGGNIASSGDLIAKKGENGGDVIVHAGGEEGSSAVISGNIDVSGKESGGIFFVKAGVVDVSDANVNLSGATPGQFVVSLGPHSVTYAEGLGGPFINWNDPPAGMTLIADDLKVSSTTQTLDGNGGVVQEEFNADPFVDLMVESSSSDQPFIQFISFNIDREGNGPAITANTDILYEFQVREPDGTFQTQYLVLDATTFANTRIGFTASGGELIQKITINSNQDGYTFDPMDPMAVPTPIGTPTPVMNTLKQVSDQVEVAAVNLLIVQKQTDPDGSPVIFDFEIEHNPTTALLYEFGLADNDEFAVNLAPDTYDVSEIVPTGWFLTAIDSSIVDSTTMTMTNIDSTVMTDLPNATATVGLASNETVTLVFHNTQGGQIIVEKVTTGPDGATTGFDFVSNFSSPFTLQGGEPGESTSFTLLPGTYTVEELAEMGWFFDGVTGADSVNGQEATVNLTSGEVVTLTFHNTQGGQIIVNKNATGPDGGTTNFDFTAGGSPSTVTDSSFMLTGGGSITLDSAEQADYLRPGTYTVEELAEMGWFFDGVTGADSVSGQEATVNLSAGEVVTLTFNNTQGGQIIVNKNATGPDGGTTNFDFTAGGSPSTVTDSSFMLTGGGSITLDSAEQADYLRPGTYTVEELAEMGWFFDGVTGADSVNGQEATVNLSAGEVVTLTFNNTQGGQIVVQKNATGPDGGTTNFDFTAGGSPSTVTDSSFMLTGGGSITLDSAEQADYLRPGTYTVEELAEMGWFFDGVTGADSVNGQEATVNLAAGEVVTLTFNNTQGGQIIVNKNATGPDGGTTNFDFTAGGSPSTVTDSSFMLTGGGSITLDSAEQADYLRPGTYTVEELAEMGWFFDGVTGADSVNGQEATVNLAAGEVVTLTFNNTQGGQIIVNKNATGPDGGTTNFDFSAGGGPSTVTDSSFMLTGGGSITLDSAEQADYLRPGTYTVEELAEMGWFFDGVTGADSVNGQEATVNLSAGEVVTLTFNNTQGGQIIVNKNATGPDGGTTNFDFSAGGGPSTVTDSSFMLTGGGSITLDSAEQADYLRPGTYTVEELAEMGWFFDGVTGADSVNGQEATVNLSAGEVVSLMFNNTQGGQIIVQKNATGPDGGTTNFDFTAGGSPSTVTDSSFMLTGGGSITLDSAEQADYLRPGTYTVEELAEMGWFFDGVTGADSVNGQEATVNLSAGEVVTLTFNNTQGGQIIVNKNATGPDGGTTNFDFSAGGGPSTVTDSSFMLTGGGSITLDSAEQADYLRPGTYTVEELAEMGWFFDGVTGADSVNGQEATVNLSAGEVVALTFNNTQGGQIIVQKNATGPNGGTTNFDFTAGGSPSTVTDSSFMLTGGGSITLDSAEQADYLRPGTYTVEELAEMGWFFDGVNGADSVNGQEATVNLSAGEVVTLTFNNTQGGQIIVNKNAAGPNGPTTTFTFDAGGGPSTITPDPFMLNGGDSITLDSIEQAGFLRPGTYTVAELAQMGWVLDGISGADMVNGSTATVNLDPGEVVSLTFNNKPQVERPRFPFWWAPIYPDGIGGGFLYYGPASSERDMDELTGESSAEVFGTP